MTIDWDTLLKQSKKLQQQGEQQLQQQGGGTIDWDSLLEKSRQLGTQGTVTYTKDKQDSIQSIKDAADKKDRNRYGIVEDLKDSVTGLFGMLGDLVEYGWTNLTNKNEDWGINDYKQYKKYSQDMANAQSQEEYSAIYKKMIDEKVINEAKYNQYQEDQKSSKDYEFTQAKEAGKNIFNNRLEDLLSPTIKKATNRYQIDAIGKGISQIENQYSMAFENVMNAYNDTRDDRILEEWQKISDEYEKNIIDITKQWAEEIVAGSTYGEAYSKTIDKYANEQKANDIVSLERQMTNKLYKLTLERNFNDAGEYADTGSLFKALNTGLLGVKNLITWGLQQINFGIEEAKQYTTDRYDIVEELANVYVFDENASGFTKTLGSAKWVGNWLLDSLPQIAPVAGEIFLTRKLPGTLLKTFDKALDTFNSTNTIRTEFRTVSRILSELTMDNLIYDEAFQTLVGHPITGEEENINLTFNTIIDSTQALLQVPAKFFNQALKKSDIMSNIVSEEALRIARKTTKDNAKLKAEELVLLRGKEITEGTRANKAFTKKNWNLDELRKTDPDLVAKYEELQKIAGDYAQRIADRKEVIDDYLLTFADYKGRKAAKTMNEADKLDEVGKELLMRSRTLKDLADYVMTGAKTTGATFRRALSDGRLSEQEIRTAIKKNTDVNGMDDLVVGLATGNARVRDLGLEKIAKSGDKLTREDINRIYNQSMIDILDTKKKDILVEGETIGGKFRKNDKGEYIDVYGVLNKGEGDTFTTYTLEDVIDYMKSNISKLPIGGDKYMTRTAISRIKNHMDYLLQNNQGNRDTIIDILPELSIVESLGLKTWDGKTVAEKNLIKKILSDVGFSVKELGGILEGIDGQLASIEKLYNKIIGLGKKGIKEYNEEDIAAYKMLYFGDIYDSFKRLLNDNKVGSKGKEFNAKEYEESFQTFFEKQFTKTKDGKYKLKSSLGLDDNGEKTFMDMFEYEATFKEIENEAAYNLIKNILGENIRLEGDDKKLYNNIKKLITEGRYAKNNTDKVLPIINSLFNQAKWLQGAGLSDKGIKKLAKMFGELVVDDKTINTLSLINSDYLYKGLISRLILEDDLGEMMYKDAVIRLVSELPSNLSKETIELKNGVNSFLRKIDNLGHADVPQADKIALLNHIQEGFDPSKVKAKGLGERERIFNGREGGVKANNGIFTIKEGYKLSEEDIDDLSTMISTILFEDNLLPNSALLDKLKNSISNTLKNIRSEGVKNLQFSYGENLKATEGTINLKLLGQAQLMQLLRDPDNVMKMLISKKMLYNSVQDGIEELAHMMDIFKKAKIPDKYKSLMSGLKGMVKGGFDKTNDELVNELIEAISSKGIDNLGKVEKKLIGLKKSVSNLGRKEIEGVEKQIDADIHTIDRMIDILNIPGNPDNAERIVQNLYNVRQVLERGKALMSSKKNIEWYENELTKTLNSLEPFKRLSYKVDGGILTTSKTVDDIWNKGSNTIFFDDPLTYKWKGLSGKKIVILDTETTGLDETSKVVQLAYRVLEIDPEGNIKVSKKYKPVAENFKWPDESEWDSWAYSNAVEKLEQGTIDFSEWEGLNTLKELIDDKDTYFVGHNISFDALRIKNGSNIEIPEKKSIDTSSLAKALLPVSKGHKQEMLIQIYEPIKNAAEKVSEPIIKKIEKAGKKGAAHNAEVDIIELQEVFAYLMNHAVKNQKTTNEGLLKFMLNTTKDMKAEADKGIISANATPFYLFEDSWRRNKFYNPMGKERLLDISTFMNQMFGSMASRKGIDDIIKGMDEISKGIPALNSRDVLHVVADKLGDERAVYILNEIKNTIREDAVIDINKVLVGEEVKDAYIAARQINPELTFADFSINRLVANILASDGKYNEGTIKALNEKLSEQMKETVYSRLMQSKSRGSTNTEAIMTFIKKLNDDGFLMLGTPGSQEYREALTKILGKLRDIDLIPLEAGKGEKTSFSKKLQYKYDKRKSIEYTVDFVEDSMGSEVRAFNKALYQYLKNGSVENLNKVGKKGEVIINKLFGEDGYYNEYMDLSKKVDLIGTAGDLNLLSRSEEGYMSSMEMGDELKSMKNKLNSLNQKKSSIFNKLHDKGNWDDKGLKEELRTIERQIEDLENDIDNYDEVYQAVLRNKGNKSNSIDNFRVEVEGDKGIYRTEGEGLQYKPFEVLEKEHEDELGMGRGSATSVDNTEYAFAKEQESQAEKKGFEGEGGIDNLEAYEEESTNAGVIQDAIKGPLNENEFTDKLLKQDTLIFDTQFLVDEGEESTKNLIKSSYNGVIDALSRKYGEDGGKLDKYLNKKEKETRKKLKELEGDYLECKKRLQKFKGTDKEFELSSEENKALYKKYTEYNKVNAENQFIYSTISTLNGTRSSMSPQQLTKSRGFNEELIGQQTAFGKIDSIEIRVDTFKKDNARRLQSNPDKNYEYSAKLFNGGTFDKNEFINRYIDTITPSLAKKNDEVDGYVDIVYNVINDLGEIEEKVERIKGQDLFDNSFGKYILNQFGIAKAEIPNGEYNKLIPALSAIKKNLRSSNEGLDKYNKWHYKKVDGKSFYEGPRKQWKTEEEWLEGLNLSRESYLYYEGLPEKLRKAYEGEIKKSLGKEEITREDIIKYINDIGTNKLDKIIKAGGYSNAGEMMYKGTIANSKEQDIRKIMNKYVRTREYKQNAKAKFGGDIPYYKVDNFIGRYDEAIETTSTAQKILDFEVEEGGQVIKVTGFIPQFKVVSHNLDYSRRGALDNSADLQNKILREEDLPNIEEMGDETVDYVSGTDYVSSLEDRAKMRREMELSGEKNYRNTYEYVHDMDEVEVRVSVTDNNGRETTYYGIMDIKRGGKYYDEKNKRYYNEAGRLRLRDLSTEKGGETLETKWYQGDWEKSTDKFRLRKADAQSEKAGDLDLTINDTSKPSIPTDTQAKGIKENKTIVSDVDDLLEEDPFEKYTHKIWNNRLLNFTNYDLYNESKEIQDIVGIRQTFVTFHGKELKEKIDEFNKLIKEYTPEQQKRAYEMINNRARSALFDTKDDDLEALTKGIPEVIDGTLNVYGLPKELQKALDEIGKIFKEGGWEPKLQYTTLSYKNDGFDGILKNIAHNHKGASMQYFHEVKHVDITGEELKNGLTNIVGRYINGDKAIKHAVEDLVGDPLGTGSMYKLFTGLRSFRRFVKYGPLLFPLSGVLMLANSAVLGIARYGSESNGVRSLMRTKAFDRLIAKKSEGGLGFTDGINRVNEIMFNSNSDLGGTFFDKALDWMIEKMPERTERQKRIKEATGTMMKGGTHSLFDFLAQGSVKTMEFAKALAKQNVTERNIDEFVKMYENGEISQELVNKILADTEKGYSRFFTNSATTFFSRHKFSRLYMFNALQGYVINRTDEIFSSLKDCINWIGKQNDLAKVDTTIKELKGGIGFNWKDFVNYINYDNQELKALLMNVLLAAKLGFYMDRLSNGGEFNGKEYSDYMIDTSDYLSSIPATFFYGILTAPLTGIEDYAEYVKMNNEDFDIGNGLTVASLNTISQVLSKFFREGKVLNALTDSIVAFGKTGNIDFSYDVLENELRSIANGLGRFQLVEGTNKYGLEQFTSERDLLGQILLNADKTTNAGRMSNKMYSIQNVDAILNGENGDWRKDKLLPYIPVIGNALQNAITDKGYNFTAAKREELQHIMDKDPVVKIINNRDLFNDNGGQIWFDKNIYTDESINRLYQELTAFDYPNKQRKSPTEFKTGYEGELEIMKETVFTDELLKGMGRDEKDLEEYINSEGNERKKQGLLKIMAAAEASRPGSSKIVVSYLANQEAYDLMKKVSGKDYPNRNDFTDEEYTEIQRQVIHDEYPRMFFADKTSWYKAITEYVSNKYTVFKDLYKDDDLTGYLSTLGYMDMLMYHQAKDGNVNAKYIKNSWSMLSKYIKNEPARINAIDYVMSSIENSGFSQGKAASAKMGVLAANMDFYDRIQKSGMMQALYGDDIDKYNDYVWGVIKELNEVGYKKAKSQLKDKTSSGNGKKNHYYDNNPVGSENVPEVEKFIPQAQKYLNGWTPNKNYSKYTPNTYSPKGTFSWQLNYYEGLIKAYSDRLVKSTGKKYPAQGTENITFKTGSNNRGSIRKQQLEFQRHKSKEYRTNVLSNLPGSHG